MSNMNSSVLIKNSFNRADATGEFSNIFYDIFLNKSVEIKNVFKDTNFKKQKKLLRATVKILVDHEYEKTRTKKIINDISHTHNQHGHNIAPHYYDLWLDSLCETIEKLDPEYSKRLEIFWRKHMQKFIDLIVTGY